MCLFPFKNNDIAGKAYKSGLREFECGACPECLAKRARKWALRCTMQSYVQKGCMITLTYDTFKRDNKGNIIGENLNLRNVDKKDAQKFVKRLRSFLRYEQIKNFDNLQWQKYRQTFRANLRAYAEKQVKKHFAQWKKTDYYKSMREKFVVDNLEQIKYIGTAEYGKRTHRPHYHFLIFGYTFPDRVPYKKSKRGNQIYMSDTLNKLWNNGICTVDTVNLSAKTARYCTKYCAKDGRTDDTFMLFSRGIGDSELLRRFNGKSYYVDGREYSIPKQIWQMWLCNKKGLQKPRYLSYKVACEKYENEFITAPYTRKRVVNKFKQVHLLDDYYCNITTIKKNKRKIYNGTFYRPDYEYRKTAQYREYFRKTLENTREYQVYLEYWRSRSVIYERYRPSAFQRILALPNGQYFNYKQSALRCLQARQRAFNRFGDSDFATPPPRSGCISRYERFYMKFHMDNGLPMPEYKHKPLQYTYYKLSHAVKNADICPSPLVIKGQMTEKRLSPLPNDWQYRPIKDEDNPFVPRLG